MKYLPDVLTVAGVALLGYGLWLYYEPLSYAVVGSLLIIGGVLMGRPQEIKAK